MSSEQSKFDLSRFRGRGIFCLESQITLDQISRQEAINRYLFLHGLDNITENPRGAYCAISLSNAPVEFQPRLKSIQGDLIDILKDAGVTAHDPIIAPESPYVNPNIDPHTVTQKDIARIARHRIFVRTDIFPSSGAGIEIEAADELNRIIVDLHHEDFETSTMRPDCSINIKFSNLKEQHNRFVELFKFLQKFEPGRGFNKDGKPILLGFRNGKQHDLQLLVHAFFPDLEYVFDPKKPLLKFSVTNTENLQRL